MVQFQVLIAMKFEELHGWTWYAHGTIVYAVKSSWQRMEYICRCANSREQLSQYKVLQKQTSQHTILKQYPLSNNSEATGDTYAIT